MASVENHVEGVNLDSLVISASSNVSSTGQLDSASAGKENTLTPELMNKVFGNELIRDHIFDYVFSSNRSGKILVNKDVLTCRLVDHTWLDYITSRLQASSSQEYTIEFKYKHKDENRGPRKYQVHKFLETWVAYPGAGSRIPLLKLEISPYVNALAFCMQSLVKCLTLCGNGLHHLTLNLGYPHDTGRRKSTNFVRTAGEINLPNLTELSVELPYYFEDHKPLACLLLSRILTGCQQLTTLSLACRYDGRLSWSRLFLDEEILSGISEQLPNTLVKLKITMNITTELLEKLLLENSLPELSWLWLGYKIDADTDVLSRIIHRYSRQLNYFFLDGDFTRMGASSSANRVVFSVMTKLKDMFISYVHPEPESEINHSFPTLQTLNLEGQTPSMLQNWTRNSLFSCVKELTVKLGKSKVKADDIFTMELSRQLHIAFPHVQKLKIHFGEMCRSEDGSIQNIFQYMPQLRDLTLRLQHLSDHPRGAYSWDAILLGVTPEYAKTLAESPREEWDSINLNHHSTPSRSILNLSRLTKFHLVGPIKHWVAWKYNLLISDLSFLFAFLRMSNLETLTLKGGFGASQEMVSEWKRRGRVFYGHVQREDGDVSSSDVESDDYYT